MSFRIVAIDDNPVVTQLIAAVLAPFDYDVETAAGAGEALVVLQRNPPDLLLDLEMPGIDGLGLLALMREKRVCDGVPVLMLTGEHDDHFVSRARELGAVGYLTKPIRAQTLRDKVARVLGDADTLWLDDYHSVRAAPGAA